MASMSDVNVIDVGHPQGLPEFDLIWSQDAGVVDLQERGRTMQGRQWCEASAGCTKDL